MVSVPIFVKFNDVGSQRLAAGGVYLKNLLLPSEAEFKFVISAAPVKEEVTQVVATRESLGVVTILATHLLVVFVFDELSPILLLDVVVFMNIVPYIYSTMLVVS